MRGHEEYEQEKAKIPELKSARGLDKNRTSVVSP